MRSNSSSAWERFRGGVILCFKFHVGLYSNHKGIALFVRTQYLLGVPFGLIGIDTTAGLIDNEMDG
mgnify:CR=1 FL=1